MLLLTYKIINKRISSLIIKVDLLRLTFYRLMGVEVQRNLSKKTKKKAVFIGLEPFCASLGFTVYLR